MMNDSKALFGAVNEILDTYRLLPRQQLTAFYHVKHRISHLLLPIYIDFQGLSEVNNDAAIEYAQDIIQNQQSQEDEYLSRLADFWFLIARISVVSLMTETEVTGPSDKGTVDSFTHEIKTRLTESDLSGNMCIWDMVRRQKKTSTENAQEFLELCDLYVTNDGIPSARPGSQLKAFFMGLDCANTPEKLLRAKDKPVITSPSNGPLTYCKWHTMLDITLDTLLSDQQE